MSVKNLYTSEGFFWWVGVVEDRNDPLFLGRCKVRIFGYHNKSTTELPTSDLPWCTPIQPITSAAISGKGHTPTGPVEGTWVTGFFLDGEDCQQPVMFGTIAGVQQKEYIESLRESTDGFKDPNKKYPLNNKLNSVDTNNLAIGAIKDTLIPQKDSNRTTDIELPFDQGKWDEPPIRYNSKYPYNHVFESESGHVIEIDDTPGIERLHVYHKSGTYLEIDPVGSMIKKTMGNDYQIIEKNGNIFINGRANITVGGSANIKIQSDCNIEVEGDIKVHSNSDIDIRAANNIRFAAGKKIEFQTKDPDPPSTAPNFVVKTNAALFDSQYVTIRNNATSQLHVVGIASATTVAGPPSPISLPPINAIPAGVDNKFPEEKLGASNDIPRTVAYDTAPYIYDAKTQKIINQLNPSEIVPVPLGFTGSSPSFPFQNELIPNATPLIRQPITSPTEIRTVPTSVKIINPRGSQYIRDDSSPILSTFTQQIYDDLVRRGWGGRRVRTLRTTIAMKDLRKELESNGLSTQLARVVFAIMILEQGNGRNVTAKNYNFVGVDITASPRYSYNPSHHTGYVVLNASREGSDGKGLNKAFASFDGIKGLVNYLKVRLASWSTITTADQFGKKWYEEWNNRGMRLYVQYAGNPAAADADGYAKGARAWRQTRQYFPEFQQ